MLVTPVLILMSGSITVFITTRVTQITETGTLLGMFSPFIFFMLKLIPYCLIWIAFTLIYMIMPNTKVHLRSALLAGIVAGTIFQIAQWGYISFQVGAARYNAIYGSFAALPLFLIWLQLSWLIVLFGAEISFADQNVDTYEFEPDILKISPGFRKLLSLLISHFLIKNFSKGEEPATATDVSLRLDIPIRLTHRILTDLVESGIVSMTLTDSGNSGAYQPAKDINLLSIASVIKALDNKGINDIPIAETEEWTSLSETLQTFANMVEKSTDNRLLKDI
jgi:membrane protein